jgi:DNA polymerase bacteriophage-type
VNIITLDFETYWDDQYTLKKMTNEEYIRDPQFRALGAAVRWPDGDHEWLHPDVIATALEEIPRPIAMICHHAHFDGAILNWRYGWKPDLWIDTLSMGRVVFDGTVSLKLESLAQYFNLQPKTVPYNLFKGKQWDQLTPHEQYQVAEGAIHDVELTWSAANYMLHGGHPAVRYPFPLSELDVVDITVRMFTEPTLVGNPALLTAAYDEEQRLYEEALNACDISPEHEHMLRKDEYFANKLRLLDVEPALKTTAKGNEKYAFAKSDYFMQDLVDSEDELVAALATARLRAQSSIYMSRTERFRQITSRGAIPIYLAYAAAHTRRWGGGDKQNAQNLPRSDKDNPRKGALKRAIGAP